MGEDPDSSFEESFRCSTSACINDNSKNRLQCGDCKRLIHLRCTMLPAYQIQLYLSKRSPKYICSNCVTVQKDLVDLLKTQDVPFYVVSRDKEEIKRLRKELSACENLLKVQGDSCRNIEKMMKEQLGSKEELKKIIVKERKDLEECVRTKTEEIKNIVKEVTTTDKTYANALTKQPSFRTIMKEAQDEKVQAIMQVAKINDLTEQRERELRATNIIIQ